MSLPSLEFELRTRIVFGPGRIDCLGDLVREFGGTRVLVVSDPGVVAAGHTERGIRSIDRAGISAFLFDGVDENPTTAHVRRGVEFAQEVDIDFVVGLGGGSAMDCAKGINFIISCGGEMKDYQGVDRATADLLPMISVPTTSGTGSETQSFALIADEHTHQKMACGDKRAACRATILDPETTISQPESVTAATGVDAITHAVETYVTKPRNSISQAFSREAWRLLESNFERVLDEPNNLDARAGMQLGASLAGLAIENSMLGAAHSCANPLTANYGVVHGGAVGLMIPHIVRYNAAEMESEYREFAAICGRDDSEGLAARLDELRARSGLPGTLREWNVDRERLPELAEQAVTQWTAQFNPRSVDVADFLNLYQTAF